MQVSIKSWKYSKKNKNKEEDDEGNEKEEGERMETAEEMDGLLYTSQEVSQEGQLVMRRRVSLWLQSLEWRFLELRV